MKFGTLTTLVALALTALLVSGIEQAVAAPPPTLTVTLSTASVTFPDEDPDFFPVSQQTGLPVQITLTTKNIGTTTPYSCSVLARGDLASGPAVIPVSNIGWTAVTLVADAGESFYSGTLSKTTAVMVAQGSGNEKRTSPLQGNLAFFIQNLWSYATGNYSQTIDFTITSP